MYGLSFDHFHIFRRLDRAIVSLILTYYKLSCLIFLNLRNYASYCLVFLSLSIIYVTLQSIVCLFNIKVVFVESFHSSLSVSFHLGYWWLERFDNEGRNVICNFIVGLLVLGDRHSRSFWDVNEELVFLFFLLLYRFLLGLFTIFVFINLNCLQRLKHIDHVPSLSRWWFLQSFVSRWQSRCSCSCCWRTFPCRLYWLLFC